MAGAPRESSLMPKIKCSSCGQQVELSMMGEHVCGAGAGGGGGAATSPPATSIDAFTPLYKGIHDKISVPPVDTAMANRSYSRQPLTPLSFSSGSRSVSPRTPGARPSIGRADDYFAPSIANEDQNPPQVRRSGGYGGFGDTDMYTAYTPASPQKAPSLLARMDDIAPGPFGSGQSASPPRGRFGGSPPRRLNDEVERPGTSASSGSNGGSMGPPRVPRKNGYGGFGPPQRENQDTDSFGGPNRSQTFPRPSEEPEPPLRTPSAPGPRPDRHDKYRNQSTDLNARMGPVTTRAPPPRTSLVRARASGGNAPSINLAEEFGDMNPYHSPSVSVSSSLSQGSSQPSYPSSSTSPARSTASARKPSDTSAFDNLMNDIQASMDELNPRDLDSQTQTPMVDERLERLERLDPAIQGVRAPSMPSSGWDRGPRSDPAIQGGLRSDSSPLPLSQARVPPPPRDPAVRGSRGNCKACGEAIVGKSISSADGRLSGRYHKACFVCTDCREPFQTAEFYVHDDRPYCKQHYHKVNGSVCGSCWDGIEGQYLEDESTKKYHVQCFRCGDCNVVLRDGYFDVEGRAYCEKDAFRRLQPQTYRRSPSMSSQRSYGSSNLAPPGRPGMRGPPPPGGPPYRPGMSRGNGRLGPPMGGGPGRGLAPSAPMPRMEKRRTRLGMM